MLTQKELEAAVRKMIANLDEVNLYFIQKIATQIKKIGEMNPTSIHRYAIMLEMGADVADISGKLQAATRLTQQHMAVVYNTALQDNFTDPRFKAALAAHPLPREENQRLIQYTRNIAAQTSGALQNLSNTTAISVPYQQAIDKAHFERVHRHDRLQIGYAADHKGHRMGRDASAVCKRLSPPP